MRKQFYFLPLLLFLFNYSFGQPCSSLVVNCTPSESRCVSTGSILVNVSGGSGNYTYKATGAVNTPTTSSNLITGLAPGSYTVEVKDQNTGCIKTVNNVVVTGNYDDPRFQLIKTDVSCANNDGTISVVNQQYGRAPFLYTIVAPSPAGVGTSNSAGHFTGLPWGEYTIQLTDSCGGIQVRKVTIESYFWWFDHTAVTRVGCDSADISITVRDNRNHLNNVDSALFNGFSYGYVLNGDTTWKTVRSFRIYIGKKRSLVLVVKDPCGNILSDVWHLEDVFKPRLDSVNLSNLACSSFTASVTGSNLTNPQFCVYNSSNVLLSCNTTGTFNNLPYGNYCIKMTDLCYDTIITRCFSLLQPQPTIDATVSITNKNCSTFSAAVANSQNLTAPTFCLYNASNVQLQCNSTGVFNNVPYGSYCIKLYDGCVDTTITRCFTVNKTLPVLTGYTITGGNCAGFDVNVGGTGLSNPNYCLYDASGNIISCDSSGVFTGIPYGSYCVKAISCSDTSNSICFTGFMPIPAVGAAVITNKTCNYFTATISGQINLTNPGFCLFDSNDSLLRCNMTGVFDSIPYGSYCIRVHNTCYDTTIIRCFSETRISPALADTIQVLSSACDSVTFKVTGTNLTQPQYCLYDASDVLLYCDTTGIFSTAYGSYCVKVHDNCADTTMVICKIFSPVRGISLTTSKPCLINQSYVNVSFASGSKPYNIQVYTPAGTMIYDSTTHSNPKQVLLPALAPGLQYKIVGTDSCGNRDTAFIVPDANIVDVGSTVKAKCPSAMWLNGSGDILATCTSNHYAVLPQIIKKNGVNFSTTYSSVLGNVYTFSDLEPAQYIIEYTQQTCNIKLYDTVTVSNYVYPSQGQSVLYQCDNNGFTLNGEVNGGQSPYSYQIIGSVPASPSIANSPQASPDFYINNGAIYSLVRLRVLDGCGNATLNDVSVLPLQNIHINASDSCFFQNIVLSVDSVKNATYYWYKKMTPVDSVLLGTGLTYNLPFFQPEEIGQYVCKMIVNSGCVTRIAYFDLFGCNSGVLANSVQLQGKKSGRVNELNWNAMPEGIKFTIERKSNTDRNFVTIAEGSQGLKMYTDQRPAEGINQYRLRLQRGSTIVYTNVVSLFGGEESLSVYPNPVMNTLTISISSSQLTDYDIELLNASGNIIFSRQLKNIHEATIGYQRNHLIQPGVYLLRVKNKNNNTTEIRKLLFE